MGPQKNLRRFGLDETKPWCCPSLLKSQSTSHIQTSDQNPDALLHSTPAALKAAARTTTPRRSDSPTGRLKGFSGDLSW